MKRLTLGALLFFVMVFAGTVPAEAYLDFTLHKLESGRPGRTLLVVGGIQGDEPGGFNAASLLVTNYRILKGSVWVVPNLNFLSIIKRSRGVYGDLNRKFASVKSSDPDFNTITRIKGIILDPRVDLVLNHHDGSGFFRPLYEDGLHNPDCWGQSIVIDQEQIRVEGLGHLGDIGRGITVEVNRHLYSGEHAYHVKNTRTRQGNVEMSKTLTYFAIQNLKPAFGVEATKAFPTHRRAYYHLRVLESFMDFLGIEYERDFDLSADGVRTAMLANAQLAFYDNRIYLDMKNVRGRLKYFPLKQGASIEFRPGSPLITVVGTEKSYRVYHGNRRLTHIHPEFFEYDSSIDEITLMIDGREKKVGFGRIVDVEDSFLVVPEEGYRVNVIGFTRSGIKNESGIRVRKGDIHRRFSVDRKGRLYRVEVYRDRKFSGMVLVNFREGGVRSSASSPTDISLLQPSGR